MSVQIGTAGAAGFTYLWTPASGLDDATLPNPIADPSTTTTYSLVVTETATGCVSVNTAEVEVVVDEDLPIADAGTGGTIDCTTLSVQIGTAGAAGFTYLWTPASGLDDATLPNPIADPSTTTTYSLVVTETATGCVSVNTAEVEVVVDEDLPIADAGTGGTIDCTTLSVQIGTAGAVGFTYLWTPASGLDDATLPNPIADPSTTTTYSLVVTETATGCVSVNTAEVEVVVDEDLPIADAGTGGTIDCTTLSVQIGTAGAAGFTYLWTPASGLDDATLPNPIADPSTTTTYSLVVTETATGCVSVNTAEVEVVVDEDLPIADAGTGGTIDCTTLSVQIGTAGAAGFTYLWTPASGLDDATLPNPIADPSTTTTYSLVVTETATGCVSVNTAEVEVVVDEDLPIADAGTGGTIDCTTLSVQIGTAGAAGFTYLWTPASGLDDATLPNPIADPSTTTTYSLVVTETATGCVSVNTAEVEVVVDEDLPVVSFSAPENLCLNAGVQNNLGGGSPLGGIYSGIGVTDDGNGTSYSFDPSAAGVGTHTITYDFTDVNGCSGLASVDVKVLELPIVVVNGPLVIDCNNPTVTLDGSGSSGGEGVTYQWTTSNGNIVGDGMGATATANQAGTYTLTVTITSTGCSDFKDVEVTVDNDLPTVVVNGPFVIDCNNTTATLDGTGSETVGVTYEWTTTNGSIIGDVDGIMATAATGGTYTFTVTETATGCSDSKNILVDEISALVCEAATIVDVDCNGTSTGSITANVTGGTGTYSYLWNDGQTTQTAIGLIAGTYSVTVKDENSDCEIICHNIVVGEPLAFSANATGTDVLCNGENGPSNDGTATVNVINGMEPFEFLWNNGATTQSISGLSVGIYEVTVTDGNGCIATSSYEVKAPITFLAIVTGTNVSCLNGGDDGAINLNINSGIGPYAYAWTGPDSFTADTEDLENLKVGIYNVLITDGNGCTYNETFTIEIDVPLYAGGDNGIEVCDGTIVDLTTLTTTTGGIFSYLGNDLNDSDFDTTGFTEGDYEIIYTVSNGGNCPDDTAIITISVIEDIIERECQVIDANFCNADGLPYYNFYWWEAVGFGQGFFSSDTTHKLTFTEYNDNTAVIKGSTRRGNCILELYVVLKDKKDWTTWSDPNNGGSFKPEGCSQAVQEDLSYYLIDGEKSYAVAVGGDCDSEGEFKITQRPDPNDPNTPNLGVVIGPGGALFDSNIGADGLAGWGWMGPENDYRKYKIDFNFLLDCEVKTGCTLPETLDCEIGQEVIHESCHDANDGVATVLVTGGTAPYTYEWSNGETTMTAVNLGAGQNNVTVTDANGDKSYCNVLIAEPDITIDLSLKVLLGGAYNPDTGLMIDYLRANGLLSVFSPYLDAIQTNPIVMAITGNNAIVDWVWIEIRDSNRIDVIHALSALIQADGDIVGVDGVSPLNIDIPPGNYHIMISHRNHLGVITAHALNFTYCLNIDLDLTVNIDLIHGGFNGANDTGDGRIALYSGDCDGDGQIQNSDKIETQVLLGTSGLLDADLDMNGQVQNSDIQNQLNPYLGKGFQSGASRAINLKLYAKRNKKKKQ